MRWVDRQAAWLAGYYEAVVRHSGLSGPDKSLSFSKSFSIAVLVSYYLNTNLPPSVAVTLIISSHGTKLLLAAIKNGVFGIHVADRWRRSAEQTAAAMKPPAMPFGGVSND